MATHTNNEHNRSTSDVAEITEKTVIDDMTKDTCPEDSLRYLLFQAEFWCTRQIVLQGRGLAPLKEEWGKAFHDEDEYGRNTRLLSYAMLVISKLCREHQLSPEGNLSWSFIDVRWKLLFQSAFDYQRTMEISAPSLDTFVTCINNLNYIVSRGYSFTFSKKDFVVDQSGNETFSRKWTLSSPSGETATFSNLNPSIIKSVYETMFGLHVDENDRTQQLLSRFYNSDESGDE